MKVIIMIFELLEKIFAVFDRQHNSDVVSYQKKCLRSRNVTSPLKLKTKNIVLPDNRTEKEIQALYTEIRKLQAENREKINKTGFVLS